MIKSAAQLKISLAILVYIWFPQITGEKFCDFFSTTATEGNSMIFSLQSQREILLFFHCSDRGKFCVFFFFPHYSDVGKFCDFFLHYTKEENSVIFFTTVTEGNSVIFFTTATKGNSVIFSLQRQREFCDFLHYSDRGILWCFSLQRQSCNIWWQGKLHTLLC